MKILGFDYCYFATYFSEHELLIGIFVEFDKEFWDNFMAK
jgi:hypothetical protein